MAYHFIAIASSYSKGTRIGWHYSSDDKLDKEYIHQFKKCTDEICGNMQFGIHKITTDSTSWKSVVIKDSFFRDVLITEDMKIFAEYAVMDRKLTALNVAKFILQLESVTHLKLQKLLYMAYSEYLMRYDKRLFEDKIVAYKYGPVVEDVFQKFTKHGSSVIDFQEDAEFSLVVDKKIITPTFASIFSSEGGIDAAEVILDIVEKFKDVDAFDMVDITHVEDGPWSRVYRVNRNPEITDSLIKRYHHLVEDEADRIIENRYKK